MSQSDCENCLLKVFIEELDELIHRMHLNSARNTKLASVRERKEDQDLEEMNKQIG